MRLSVRQLVGLLLVLLIGSDARAQTWGSCEAGTAQAFLETPFLKASVFNTGGLFFGGSTVSGDGYLIPKQGGTRSPVFAAGLWLGGMVNDSVRVAAARYGGWNFWPGPLEDAATPPVDCSAYDRIYVVSREDIRRYYRTGELAEDLRDWPHQLGAPVIDGDGIEDNYDLRAGDQPDLIGDVATWWVMNDAGNEHPPAYGEEMGTPPLGVEVRVLAFVYSEGAFSGEHQTTFFRYNITNRGNQPIEKMYASMWADLELGGADDDYIGTDTLRNMVFVYNSDDEDGAYGIPPAWGMQILQGPVVGEDTLRLTGSSTYYNGPSGTADPGTAEQYYNYMRSLWADQTPIREMRTGYFANGPITTFQYPGDPVTKSFWSEMNSDGNGTKGIDGSKRIVASTGPFRLAPDSTQTLLYTMPFGQGTNHLHSITVLRGLAGGLQQAHAAGFFASRRVEEQPVDPATEALRLSRVAPNPSQGGAIARLHLPTASPVHAAVYDALGRQLEVLVDGVQPPGETELAIPEGLAPGVYRLRVRVEPGGEDTLTFTVAR
ncbi:MAG: hypothetical protein Rubg2KO_29560 [Rubricoccaceae bacterium]